MNLNNLKVLITTLIRKQNRQEMKQLDRGFLNQFSPMIFKTVANFKKDRLKYGNFPDNIKIAKFSHIYKKGDKN